MVDFCERIGAAGSVACDGDGANREVRPPGLRFWRAEFHLRPAAVEAAQGGGRACGGSAGAGLRGRGVVARCFGACGASGAAGSVACDGDGANREVRPPGLRFWSAEFHLRPAAVEAAQGGGRACGGSAGAGLRGRGVVALFFGGCGASGAAGSVACDGDGANREVRPPGLRFWSAEFHLRPAAVEAAEGGGRACGGSAGAGLRGRGVVARCFGACGASGAAGSVACDGDGANREVRPPGEALVC